MLVARTRETGINEFIILPIKLLDQVSRKLKIKKNQRNKPAYLFVFHKLKTGVITLNYTIMVQ